MSLDTFFARVASIERAGRETDTQHEMKHFNVFAAVVRGSSAALDRRSLAWAGDRP